MSINLVDICMVKFPGQIEGGNITFRHPSSGLVFDTWSVPGVPRPTEQEIMSEEPLWEKPFAIFQAFALFNSSIELLLNSTAQSKQYDSALSIASYANSSNVTWASEADAFIDWRDAVFEYSINIQIEVESGRIPIPTLEEFLSGVPVIIWPQ